MSVTVSEKRLLAVAEAYERASRSRFPSVRYLPDPDAGDMCGGVIAAFMVPDGQRQAFREFMLTTLADAVEREGIEYLGAVIHTEEQTKAHYPLLYRKWLDESRPAVYWTAAEAPSGQFATV